jgi:hypothetical protein
LYAIGIRCPGSVPCSQGKCRRRRDTGCDEDRVSSWSGRRRNSVSRNAWSAIVRKDIAIAIDAFRTSRKMNGEVYLAGKRHHIGRSGRRCDWWVVCICTCGCSSVAKAVRLSGGREITQQESVVKQKRA